MLVQSMPVQDGPMTIAEFLAIERTDENRRDELEFGWLVREGWPNVQWHELDAFRLASLLSEHVRERDLGLVFCPAGLLLDEDRALFVIPDVSVVLDDRLHLVGGKIMGAPHLVVEVASPSTQTRDRGRKLSWYRAYGVQECWLVDARKGFIEVHRMRLAPDRAGRVYRGEEVVETEVLPEFRLPVSQLLAHTERERIARFSYDRPGS